MQTKILEKQKERKKKRLEEMFHFDSNLGDFFLKPSERLKIIIERGKSIFAKKNQPITG